MQHTSIALTREVFIIGLFAVLLGYKGSNSLFGQEHPDQNPRYKESREKYLKQLDSIRRAEQGTKDVHLIESPVNVLQSAQEQEEEPEPATPHFINTVPVTVKDNYESSLTTGSLLSKQQKKKVYEAKMDFYQQMKMYDKALESAKLVMAYNDSILKEENRYRMAKVAGELAMEKKDRQIAFLKQEKDLENAEQARHRQLAVSIIIGLLLLSGLFFMMYKRKKTREKLTLEKELAESKQKALHLQMNPHFIFNCLGSISSFIAQNNPDLAIKYLSKFSRLMRLTLEYSKASLIPVAKEAEIIKNYLELEQLRFNHKFDFDIHLADDIEDDLGLPPMLIQPFVENAVLHGMAMKNNKGKIEVTFQLKNSSLLCKIQDDGVGRKVSQEMKEKSVAQHKSMAMDITKKRLKILGLSSSKAAQFKIEDLKNNTGEVAGTLVTIELPLLYIN